MTSTATTGKAPTLLSVAGASLSNALRAIVLLLLCLTPVGALLVLGWLTRKTRFDTTARLTNAKRKPWPNILRAENPNTNTRVERWAGALLANLSAGTKAWAGALLLTLPFTLVWAFAWTAGWDNSFNKGYEYAGVWPGISLAAVLLSLPALIVLPMALTHQAHTGKFATILHVGHIARLIRAAGGTYLLLTVLSALGSFGVLGARVMPVFAEKIAPELTSGSIEATKDFAGRYTLIATAMLLTGLIIVRSAMALCYARATTKLDSGKHGSVIATIVVLPVVAAIWLALVFFVYFAQFMNFAWWHWFNQPVLMLPWLNVIQ